MNASEVRKHFAAARTIRRNTRLRRYHGRASAYTDATLRFHEDKAMSGLRTLPRELQGMLWAEHQLAARISENRDDGQDRPELRERLRVLRRGIRVL